MAETGKSQYRKVLAALKELAWGRDSMTINWKDILVIMDIELGVRDERKVWNMVQNMVHMKYLIPVQCGVGVMDRVYEIGEAGAALTETPQEKLV